MATTSDHPAAPAVLTVEGLRFAYPDQVIFDALSASIPAGVTLVRGGDGRGKTTLLRVLAGEWPAQAGRLRIGEVDAARDPVAWRRLVHWVDPRTQAFDPMKATDWLAAARAQWPDYDSALADELIDGLSLAPHLDKQLFMLSTGSKRKVWLVAQLASRAAVTLLDDPFASLDRPSIRCVERALATAAASTARALVFSGYEDPGTVPLSALIDLGD